MKYKDLFINNSETNGSQTIHGSGHLYDIGIYNEYSNLGIRLAYFLWIMRGENSLDHMSYYGKNFKKMSDGENVLRGGYGPRLRYWVGADQLQESIDINADIDKEEDYVKPKGIDQLEKIYNDLKAGLSTCCSVFNPALDFEDSNNIPDLISMGFKIQDNKLFMKAFINNAESTGSFMNDYFFLTLLAECYRNLFSLKTYSLTFNIMNHSNKLHSIKEFDFKKDTLLFPSNRTPEEMWSDIFSLCSIEKHLRNCFSKESLNSSDTNILNIVDHIIDKHLNTMKCEFWKEFGLALIGYVLIKKGGMKYFDYVSEQTKKMKTPLKDELQLLIGDVNV